nr:MAG TPA: hypothetical protein [Caudoviricetes sp.]DAQ83090.1 MAG TPA: hypothetical protein [Caudoviricetes sp.]
MAICKSCRDGVGILSIVCGQIENKTIEDYQQIYIRKEDTT